MPAFLMSSVESRATGERTFSCAFVRTDPILAVLLSSNALYQAFLRILAVAVTYHFGGMVVAEDILGGDPMQFSVPRSSTSLALGSVFEWRISVLILVAALFSVSQGCGIISDASNRATSTRAVLPPESRSDNRSIDQPQAHTVPRERSPIARIPASPQTEAASPLPKIPAPSRPTVVQTGLASWYGRGFHGKRTASGEVFDQEKFTAAHPTLPWGSRVKVTNLANGKSVEVRINDRGPFGKGRIIDVSRAAARTLGIVGPGIAAVRVEWLSDSEKSNELVLQDK